MKKWALHLGSICICLIPLLLNGQTKYEKESRIKTKEAPPNALEFINSQKGLKKVKWYLEESLNSHSIESKFKFNSLKHSVEFDTSGVLQDIEIEIKYEAIPPLAQKNLCTHLNQTYDQFRIKKIQEQYIGNYLSLVDFFAIKDDPTRHQIRYEIVVQGKLKNQWEQYEIVFDHDGMHQGTSLIIMRNPDNLEY